MEATEYTYRGVVVRFCPRCGRPPLHPSDCSRCQKARNALAMIDELATVGLMRDALRRGWHFQRGGIWHFIEDRDLARQIGRG